MLQNLLLRRQFLAQAGIGLGGMALADLLASEGKGAAPDPANPLAPREPHFPPKAKQMIHLFMAGGPSQLELFTDKPKLRELHGKAPPAEELAGKRFAFLKGNEKLLGSPRRFARYGQCGMQLSELLPHHQKIVDDVCWVRSLVTDVFNHGPAKLFLNTGFNAPGRPSLGAWATYGLGSPSRDLPGYVVLQSGPRGPRAGATLWSSGFLPSTYQGVPFRSQGDPILYLRNPPGVDAKGQRDFFDFVKGLNDERLAAVGDPEIQTRINAYEMAYRMQASGPELMDLSKESKETLAAYGVEPGKPSFALNCLIARRLIERGVRFVQLYHTDWDHHGGPGADLEKALEQTCKETDQASAALVKDLKDRGLLDETLVMWGGEFGRTPVAEGGTGRDHNHYGFTCWLAGGGVKRGHIHGATDELGFQAVEKRVHVHDLHATIMHLLGFDHTKLTYRYAGRDFRLTDVHGHVVREALA